MSGASIRVSAPGGTAAAASTGNLRGTLAARPAAGVNGRLYTATDTNGFIYRDNGSSWQAIAHNYTFSLSTSDKDTASGVAGLDSNTLLKPAELPNPHDMLYRQFGGAYIPPFALDRWRHNPNPLKTIAVLEDSVGQGTVGQVDGEVQRLRRGLALDITNNADVVAGAGWYPLSRLTGSSSTGFEWYRVGTWTQQTSLVGWDQAVHSLLYNSSVNQAATRRFTDGVTTANSTTATSATAAFTSADVGCPIYGTNIARNTVIATVSSGTTVLLSQPATGTGSGQTADIAGSCLIWTRPLSHRSQQRTVFDGATNTNTTVTSATAAFVAQDVGAWVIGPNIPSGTTIASVTNATTIVLSAAATGTATARMLSIGPAEGRIVSDAVTATSTTVTSATAAFTKADIGKQITGTNIANNATITAVASATSVTVSAATLAGATGGTLIIANATPVSIAELVVFNVELNFVSQAGWSYSTDGGATWVAVAFRAAASPGVLTSQTVTVTNPTTLIIRNQVGSTANGSANTATLQAGILAHGVAAATAGIRTYNYSIDGKSLKNLAQGRTVADAVTASNTTVTSATAAFAATDVGSRIIGTNIPGGSTTTTAAVSLSAVTTTVNVTAVPAVFQAAGTCFINGHKVTFTGATATTLTGAAITTFTATSGPVRTTVIPTGAPVTFITTITVRGSATSVTISNAASATTSGASSRTVADMVTTANSTTITSATAAFVGGDVGKLVSGDGIPANTTIASVTSGTAAVLSQSVPQAQTGASITIGVAYLTILAANGDPYAMLYNVQDTALPYTWNAYNGSNPDLVFIGLSNDLVDSHDPTGYCNYLQDAIDRLLPNSDMIVYAHFEQGGNRLNGVESTAPIQAAYRKSIHTLCLTTNQVGLFDAYDHFVAEGYVGSAATITAGLMVDTAGTHPSQRACNDLAASKRRMLVGAS